eukprot:scaffold1_cov375-Pavlova_lutheri.AAC.49
MNCVRLTVASQHVPRTPTTTEPGTQWASEAAMTKSNFPYHELVGCLMYLAVSTRPDIAYVTNCLARYVFATRSTYVAVAKRILK